MPKYIHEYADYPNFTWKPEQIMDALARVANMQGQILGKMQQFGFGDCQIAMLNAMTEEITKSSEIEGEILNSEQVRSSLAKRLNIHMDSDITPSHHIDGIVQTMMDAINNYNQPLTDARLFGWHAALFPTGYSGMYKINVGQYRTEEMQVVSNRTYSDRVHYTAPAPDAVPAQMQRFLDWINADSNVNPIIKAAIAHLWFVIIHPFDDGNGRIARTITEMMLARAENTSLRFYSMSSQIQKEKGKYYKILEQTTTGDMDITTWILWFLDCLYRAMTASRDMITTVLQKSAFWQKYSADISNPKQREIINRLLDGFEGRMTSGKAAKFLHTSQDTAARLLQDLATRGFLTRIGAGRTTHYELSNK